MGYAGLQCQIEPFDPKATTEPPTFGMVYYTIHNHSKAIHLEGMHLLHINFVIVTTKFCVLHCLQ